MSLLSEYASALAEFPIVVRHDRVSKFIKNFDGIEVVRHVAGISTKENYHRTVVRIFKKPPADNRLAVRAGEADVFERQFENIWRVEVILSWQVNDAFLKMVVAKTDDAV